MSLFWILFIRCHISNHKFYIPLNLFKVIVSFSKIEHNLVWFACLKNKSLQSLKKNWHSCQKPSKILKFVLKSLQKKLCYIEEQLQEIQICKKPNYKYQVHMHHNTMDGGGTSCLMFLFLITVFPQIVSAETILFWIW